MDSESLRELLKNKIVCDFRGYPIGRVKKIWFDQASGPLVVVEREGSRPDSVSWEAIPLRAVDTVREQIRLKPPVFAE
ncbi:MAG: hypothetical protein ACTSV3_08515 [Candidatus Thorarchaeota archaeon]